MSDLSRWVDVRWPVGPTVAGGSGVGAARARVAFKLDSAAWYIDRLEEIGDEFGFDRLFGVEMALDGALTALCGAVDAAERVLLRAVAQLDGWRPVSRDARPPRRDLTLCDGLVGRAGRELAASHVERAWLRTLKDLRNRAVHESTLDRYVSVVISAEGQLTTVGLSVPGQSQPVDPPDLLRQAHENARALCGLLLDAAESAGDGSSTPTTDRQSVAIHAPAARAQASASPASVTVAPPE